MYKIPKFKAVQKEPTLFAYFVSIKSHNMSNEGNCSNLENWSKWKWMKLEMGFYILRISNFLWIKARRKVFGGSWWKLPTLFPFNSYNMSN